MLRQGVGGVLILLMCGVACTPSTSPPSGDPVPTASSATSPGKAETSQGDWYDVVRRTVSATGRAVAFPIALASDGSALVVHSKPRGESIPKQTLHLRDASWGKVGIPRARGARHRQVVSGALRGRFVVWKETESVDAVSDEWSIYSYDIKTKRVRQLGGQTMAAPDGVAYVAPGGTTPTLGVGARVYFSAVDYSDDRQGRVRVFEANARREFSAEPTESGLAAQIHGANVFLVKEDGEEFNVVRQTVGMDDRQVLYRSSTYPECPQVSAMKGNSEGRVAIQLQCGKRTRLGLVERGKLDAGTRVDRARAGYLALTEHFLWYASPTPDGSYRQHVHVLGHSGYRRVGTGSVSGECVCGGRLFSWARFRGDKAVRTYARLR